MNTTKKVTKKQFKPAFIIDATDCETEYDFLVEKALAKYEAGVDLNTRDVDYIIDYTVCDVFDSIEPVETVVFVAKKKPWYKRFWNWITGKK